MEQPIKTNEMNNENRIMIIDDEPESTRSLEMLIRELYPDCVVFTYNDSELGFQELEIKKPDLLFLDLQMPCLSGIEILKLIEKQKIHVHIIIITAFEKLILKAAHFSMIDYILKPVSKDELRKSLTKFKNHYNQHKEQDLSQFLNYLNQKIRIPTSSEILFFFPEEIIYLEADGAYTQIYLTNDKKITSSFHLKKIQEQLPKGKFYRISRKHIINYSYLFKIDKKTKECLLNHQVKITNLPYSKSILTKSGLII